ncbi:MAG: hypothetical protein M3248_04965 [Actinomycetota bacterium]|nr:hypothetical protein [Actinomycetota bacterium]
MLEVRIAENLVRFSRSSFEPGGWAVLVSRDGVVVREYRCRDARHAEAVAAVLRRAG